MIVLFYASYFLPGILFVFTAQSCRECGRRESCLDVSSGYQTRLYVMYWRYRIIWYEHVLEMDPHRTPYKRNVGGPTRTTLAGLILSPGVEAGRVIESPLLEME
jgi:hypothetical protein